MISWLMSATGLNSIVIYLIAAGVIFAGIYGYGWYQYDTGYNQAKIEWSLKLEKLKSDYVQRQNDFVEHMSKANEIAKSNEAQKLIEYEAQIALRDKIIEENQAAILSDPNSSNKCLSLDGVRRLNKLD